MVWLPLPVVSFQSGRVIAAVSAPARDCRLSLSSVSCAEGVFRSGATSMLLILSALAMLLVLLMSLAKLALTLPPAWITER